jgi:hypothetical protein
MGDLRRWSERAWKHCCSTVGPSTSVVLVAIIIVIVIVVGSIIIIVIIIIIIIKIVSRCQRWWCGIFIGGGCSRRVRRFRPRLVLPRDVVESGWTSRAMFCA